MFFCIFFINYFLILFIAVHEKTLIHCLDMMSLWCCKFSYEIPKQIIEGLQVWYQNLFYVDLRFLRLSGRESQICLCVNFVVLYFRKGLD